MAEVAKYPGVEVQFTHGRKHPRATLRFRGQSRFVVYPKTSKDERGKRNTLAWLRRELSALGATA